MSEVRLIDAEALKKALKSNCKPELCHDYNSAWCESCCPHNEFEDLIDEAPTVEYTFEEAFQKTVCEKRLYRPARPQGEWVRKEDVIQSIAKQYSEHNELVPAWLSIGDIKAVQNEIDN